MAAGLFSCTAATKVMPLLTDCLPVLLPPVLLLLVTAGCQQHGGNSNSDLSKAMGGVVELTADYSMCIAGGKGGLALECGRRSKGW